MSDQSSKNAGDFKLERYKYILQQLHSLNESVHKYLTLFQTLATAIVGVGIAVFVSWKELKIDANIAKLGIQGLFGLLTILTLFVIISIVASIFSWFDYRRDEVKILDEAVKSGYRKLPEWKNCWRWSETYIILFLIISLLVIYWFVYWRLLPLIN